MESRAPGISAERTNLARANHLSRGMSRARRPGRQDCGVGSTDGVYLELLVDYLKQDWMKSGGCVAQSGFRGMFFSDSPRMGDR